MIAEEARCGRLTPIRRARIVRFASQLGLSAVETGRLIEECRRNCPSRDLAAGPQDAGAPAFSPPRSVRMAPRVAIVTGMLLLVIWLLR
jgi:hypothetical protein